MGVNLVRAKLLAFALGASFSGLAGAVFASMLSAIVPDMFQFQVSIFLLIIVILSGVGSVWGVLLGGLLISIFDGVFLAQVLPRLLPDSDVQNLRWVFFGFGLVAFMILRPQGLFGATIKKRGEAPPLAVQDGSAV
jgi:branched-chain amino acid transport system permease protein